MNEAIRNLEPRALWNKFADLNAVPRPSKKEERVISFMKDFGHNLGLETIEDEVGNVIVRNPKKQVTLIIIARNMFLFLPVFFVYECVLEHKFIKINFVRYIVIYLVKLSDFR